MRILTLPHDYVHSLALCHSLAHSNTDQLIILQDVTQVHYMEARESSMKYDLYNKGAYCLAK